MGFHKTPYGRLFPDTILRSLVAKSKQKFENDCISRNWHRIKITQVTQPKLMILVSFSSVEDALSNDVKKIYITLLVCV